MGVYCTLTSVLGDYPIFPQTSTVQRYTETAAVITAKEDRADAMINSYIGRRYALPLASTPPLINQIAIDLSAYLALVAKFTRDNHNTNDWVIKLGEDTLKQLVDIRDRKIDLVDSSGAVLAERTASTRITSNTEDYQAFADLDSQTSWAVPKSRLDAIDRNG